MEEAKRIVKTLGKDCLEWNSMDCLRAVFGLECNVLVKAQTLVLLMEGREVGGQHGEEEEREIVEYRGRSAKALVALYAGRYASVAGDRAKEDALREQKCTELVLVIVLRLQHLARLGADPASKADSKAVLALFECVSVLLVPLGQWQDFVDFCYDLVSSSLPLTMAQIFQRLDVQPHIRDRVISVDGIVEKVVHQTTTAAVTADKKLLRTQLKHTAADEEKEKKTAAPRNLHELRSKEKDKRKQAKPITTGVVPGTTATIQRKVHAKARKIE